MTDEFLYRKVLDDGREVCVQPMSFGNVRLTIGPAGSGMYDHGY